MQNFLKINEKDNVVVALQTLPEGTVISVPAAEGAQTAYVVSAGQEIPAGHKMAICDIPEGGEVIKYGYRIGIAKTEIRKGDWVHTHNMKTGLGELLDYSYCGLRKQRRHRSRKACQYEICGKAAGRGRRRGDRIPPSLWVFPDG